MQIKDINIHHEVIEILAIKEELTIQSLTDDIHIANGKTKFTYFAQANLTTFRKNPKLLQIKVEL